MYHIEDTLNSVKTVISGGIAAKLTALQTSYGDGVRLDAPQSYYISEIQVIDQYPAIQILPDTTNTKTAANRWDDDEDNIIIIVHNTAQDGVAEKLAKTNYRYAKAISDLIKSNHTLNTSTYGFARKSINYKNMTTNSSNILRQEVWIHCSVLCVR